MIKKLKSKNYLLFQDLSLQPIRVVLEDYQHFLLHHVLIQQILIELQDLLFDFEFLFFSIFRNILFEIKKKKVHFLL
jgi:hypothetical protein